MTDHRENIREAADSHLEYCCELDIWGRDAEFWVTLAEDFAEMMAEVK